MAREYDFVVKYDPDNDTSNDLTKRIIYAIFVRRLLYKKPVVIFVGGDSGEGKSLSILTLEWLILSIQGIDLRDVLHDVNVYTPLEYPKKLDALLGMKNINPVDRARLKKVNVIAIHEARELIKAKTWYSFLNQAIGDINALSRAIKRLCIIVCSQFIRDISTDIRYTLNFYITIKRPLGKPARLYINVMWKDDRDLERPRLRKRRIYGLLVLPDGRRRAFCPAYLEVGRPPIEIVQAFDKKDYEAKAGIIRRKIDKLIKNMEVELDAGFTKVGAMVDYYTKNIENLNIVGKMRGKKWIIKPEIKAAHDMTDAEYKEFQIRINEKIKKMNFSGKHGKAADFSDDEENYREDEIPNENIE